MDRKYQHRVRIHLSLRSLSLRSLSLRSLSLRSLSLRKKFLIHLIQIIRIIDREEILILIQQVLTPFLNLRR